MDPLRTLLVQARIRWKDPAENRAHLQSLVQQPGKTFDLLVLPETFTTGFLGDTDLPQEDMQGPSVAWMKSVAEEFDSAVAGSVVIMEHGQRYNRLLFITPEGAVTYYDKRHLFAFGGEDKRYTPGNSRVVINYRGWRIYLQICYDLRFPAWCRNRDDYDLMLLVANWPAKRVHHWLVLLEARAIENQSWVIGLNRVGKDGNGLDYPGRSVVFDPLGASAADLGGKECTQLVSLDLEQLKQVRRDFPFQNDADAFEFSGRRGSGS
ncbi:MAG: amidohydrolase [Xanthomonadales bacterium]